MSVPTIIPKKLEEFETLKEAPLETRLIIEIYEKRIQELNEIIRELLPKTPVVPAGPVYKTPENLITKNKIATMSQLVAKMEEKTRIGEKK